MRIWVLFMWAFLIGGSPGLLAEEGVIPPEKTCCVKTFDHAPLYFIENLGQMSPEVSFYLQGTDKTLFFTPKGVTFKLNEKQGSFTVKLDFVGAADEVVVRGQDRHEAVFSYFKGASEDWKINVPSYSGIIYKDLWPGIDLIYSGTVNALKYRFLVKPGVDPDLIRLAYRGAEGVAVNNEGELQVETPLGGFKDARPRAYQDREGKRSEVSMRYALHPEVDDQAFAYGFRLGAYDPELPLVLDPAILVYCGFIGGVSSEQGRGIAVDGSCNAYVTGYTDSWEGFPLEVGPDLTMNGVDDAFVAKISPDGSTLLYCGYIGGSGFDIGLGIAVDETGSAYVTGYTESTEATFPVVGGPQLTYNGGKYDAFVAKVNAAGTHLDYCGYLGGVFEDRGHDIAVDGNGKAHVTGYTDSTEATFPVAGGPDLTYNGGVSDAFLARINAAGTGFDYVGYLGGEGLDKGNGVAVDADGQVYLTGITNSQAVFPLLVGPDLTYNGKYEGFVAKVKNDGSGLLYCGYIGGNSFEEGNDIAVDGDLCAYVTGHSDSPESCFQMVVGPDLIHNGYGDAFAAKVSADGTHFVYCGYIGGAGHDVGRGIAVDGEGHAYIAGDTASMEDSFPVTGGPSLIFSGGTYDAFVAKVKADGTGLDYAGYIGGEDWDQGFGIAVGSSAGCQGRAYVVGQTWSDEVLDGFPVLVGPDLSHNGSNDAFVACVDEISPLDATGSELSVRTGGVIHLLLHAGPDQAGRAYLVLGTLSGTEPGLPINGGTVLFPLNWDGFTNTVIAHLNSQVFWNFMGSLDGSGAGTARIDLPQLSAGKIGKVMHYAFILGNPIDYASNAVAVALVP